MVVCSFWCQSFETQSIRGEQIVVKSQNTNFSRPPAKNGHPVVSKSSPQSCKGRKSPKAKNLEPLKLVCPQTRCEATFKLNPSGPILRIPSDLCRHLHSQHGHLFNQTCPPIQFLRGRRPRRRRPSNEVGRDWFIQKTRCCLSRLQAPINEVLSDPFQPTRGRSWQRSSHQHRVILNLRRGQLVGNR